MNYKFYVQMDGQIFGPYTAKEVRELNLLDDVLVTEESMSEWLPAGRFDFDAMIGKELGSFVNEDGTITRPNTSINVPNEGSWDTYRPLESPQQTYVDRNIVPDEVKGWNWGAFYFNLLWCVFNGIYWPLLLILACLIPFVGSIVVLIMPFVFGANGNKWAWKAKSWESVEHFKRVQRRWSYAALIVFIINVLSIVFSLGYYNVI